MHDAARRPVGCGTFLKGAASDKELKNSNGLEDGLECTTNLGGGLSHGEEVKEY